MIWQIVLLMSFAILQGCGSFQLQKTIKFQAGQSGKVFYEIQTTDSKEKILFAEFTNERSVRKEKVVEEEVIEIWSAVKSEAEKEEIEEGLIKYRFPNGEKTKNGERVFEGLLFTADRRENGTWSIKRVS